MRAVSFNVTIPGYVLGKGLGRVTEAALFGGLSGVRYGEVAEPGIPGRDWVRLEVLKAGICGSDIGALTFKTSPAMEPFSSFPAVLGHEILARVLDVGPDVRRVEPGQRVAVDPVISCTMRGFGADRCPSCVNGLHGTCERSGEEGDVFIAGRRLRAGLTVGFQADLAGGWGERMIAHESQLFPLDDRLADRTAVLLEPLAVGMHAALGSRPFGSGPVLVIGSGPIALGTIWALRAAGYEGELVAQIKRGHEADIARALGASGIVSPGDQARQGLVETGAQAYMPIIGDEVYAGGGFPLIFDCVGSGETVKQSLRYAAPRGRIVMLGCAAEIRKLDLTFVWARELEIKGYVCYGDEEWRGARKHTFEVTHDLLLETGAPVERMVTHVYPLGQYRDALSAAANRRSTGSIKVLLDPTAR
ncbi:MAG TPA: alcohol dehydrogenase catalytic domain-containing protein [Longimicrobiales bacterium]|nr:alcohol dehydrogenase catalytic domain-containing protein [Longimicrobiales bacterium]